MPYPLYDATKPDPATQSGTAFGTSTRENLLALRDAATLGIMPWWNFSQAGGTASKPAQHFYKKSGGTEWLKLDLTWGSSGGSNGKVTVTTYSYSANSGSSWSTIGTETRAFDSAANLTSTTWS